MALAAVSLDMFLTVQVKLLLEKYMRFMVRAQLCLVSPEIDLVSHTVVLLICTSTERRERSMHRGLLLGLGVHEFFSHRLFEIMDCFEVSAGSLTFLRRHKNTNFFSTSPGMCYCSRRREYTKHRI